MKMNDTVSTIRKRAIVTGAAGFLGYHLIKCLSESGYCVDAIVRPDSEHNMRIQSLCAVQCVEVDAEKMGCIPAMLSERYDYLFHLLWKPAARYDYEAQMENAYLTLKATEIASRMGCKRFIGIGSQAEYGATDRIIVEDELPPNPFCAYGVSKTAACFLSRKRAKELGIEWVWGRVFSVYGEYEPSERLIPFVMNALGNRQEITLSSCRQNWDFLYGKDAGDAILAMAERGKDGQIYNIADGGYRPLKSFITELEDLYGVYDLIRYGRDPDPFVSLQPSIEKLKSDTGWKPSVRFDEGIRSLKK